MYIRADGNSIIGMGHLMRTMSIASQIRELTEVIYLCADYDSAKIVNERGFEAEVLDCEPFSVEEARKISGILENKVGSKNIQTNPNDRNDEIDLDGQNDKTIKGRQSNKTGQSSKTGQSDKIGQSSKTGQSDKTVLLIDSYLFDEEYLNILSDGAAIAIMDDMVNYPYPCDMLINYNVYASDEEYIKLYESAGRKLPILVLGGAYIPLREEFVLSKKNIENIDKADINKADIDKTGINKADMADIEDKNTDILITTGGSDQYKLSYKIVKKLLESISLSDRKLHVVAGKFSSAIDELRELAKEHSNVEIHENVKNMAELMGECSIAVSAGGSTCYELCAMECAFVVFSYAENQVRLADSMVKCGVALFGGNIHSPEDEEPVIDNISFEIEHLLNDEELRRSLIEKERELVSKTGALNLSKKIYELMEGNT